MDARSHYGVEEIDSPLQRTTHRRSAFFALPIAAEAIASALFFWEVLRQNLPPEILGHWPWKLRVFDLESGATIVTVLAVIILTRAQYAVSARPIIGGSLHPTSQPESCSIPWERRPILELTIFNGGATAAAIKSFSYRLARNEDPTPSAWLSHDGMQKFMSETGLASQLDYLFWYRTPGGILAANTTVATVPIRDYIRLDSFLKFRIFDVKIEVYDGVGDTHERVIPYRANLRDPALLAFLDDSRSAAPPRCDNSVRRIFRSLRLHRGL
jgi:hypothetical protein